MTQDELPERIGDYQILHRLAVGGMAEIFLGRAAGTGGFEKLVAIKRVRPHLALVPSFVEMFLDEARIAAKLTHSNIVQIYDLGRSGDSFYIAMEYVPGLSLREVEAGLFHQGRRASPSLTALVVMNVCMALDHAHTKRDSDGTPLNIIHRDVSPSNVVISFDGDVKLIDFGIVRASQRLHRTQVGQIKGKPGYISPEQLRGAQADARSDVFAVGIVLYGLLTHQNPFREEKLDRALPAPATLAHDVPADLEAICVKATAFDPDRRYQSAAAMTVALEACWQRSPLSRLQLATWMKATFRDEYERQMLLAGLPSRPLSFDDTASIQATIPHRPAGAAQPSAVEGELSTTLPPRDADVAARSDDISDLPTREITAAASPTEIGAHAAPTASVAAARLPVEQPAARLPVEQPPRRPPVRAAVAVLSLVVASGLIVYLLLPEAPAPSARSALAPLAPPAAPPAPTSAPLPGDASAPRSADGAAPAAPATRRAAGTDMRVTSARPARRVRRPAVRPERKRVVDERRKADDDGQRRAPSKKQKQDKLPYESL